MIKPIQKAVLLMFEFIDHSYHDNNDNQRSIAFNN